MPRVKLNIKIDFATPLIASVIDLQLAQLCVLSKYQKLVPFHVALRV